MSQINILDGQFGEIIGIISGKHVIEDEHTQSLEGTLERFDFIIPADIPYTKYLSKRNRLIIPDEDDGYKEFIIMESGQILMSSGERRFEVYSLASYHDLALGRVVYPEVLRNQSPSTAVSKATQGTGWVPGLIEGDKTRTLEIESHTNPLAFLKHIATEFDLELNFRIETDGNRVTGRYVDLLEQIGTNRGREITLGRDLEGIRRTEKTDNIVTALIGLGPEDSDGNRLEVIVEDEDALQRWGRPDPSTGNLRHLIEVYEPQSERSEMTEAELRRYTRTELDKRINEIIEYEADIVDLEHVPGMQNKKIRFGDTIRIKDEGFNPPLYVEARVFEQSRSIVDPSKKKVKLGDFEEFTEEEVRNIWDQLRKDIQKRVTAAEMAEYTYNKLTIDQKDETVFEEGKSFAEATGIEAKEHADFKAEEAETNAKGYADEQDEILKSDVEKYAEEKADSALSSAKQYAVAKEVYENEMTRIASDIEDRAPLEYVDGEFKIIKDDIEDFNAEIEKKADGSTVYTIEEVDNMINNTVSKTEYTADMDGVISDIESHGTRIGQNEEAIGLKADESYVDTVENSLNTKIGNVEVKADGVITEVSEVRADLDGLEIGGRNLLPSFNSNRWDIGKSAEQDEYELVFPEGTNPQVKIIVDVEKNTNYTMTFNSDHARYYIYEWVNGEQGKYLRTITEGSDVFTFNTGDLEQILILINSYSERIDMVRNVWKPKLEKGNKATDWTPAPEDIDESINQVSGRVETLDASVETLAGEVSLKASQSIVDSLEGRVENAEAELNVLPGQIELKADAAKVDGIDDRLGSAEIIIDGLESEIKLKADLVDIEGMLTADDLAVRKDLEFGGVLRGPEGILGDVTVTDGDFNLQDKNTGNKYSATPRRNLIRDHSFELIPEDGSSMNSDSVKYNWLEIEPNSDLYNPSTWERVGSPKVAITFSPDTLEATPMFGDKAIVVRNANYVRQYVHEGVAAGSTFTISAHFKRQWNQAPGEPRFEVWHLNGDGSRKSRIFNTIFDRVSSDYSKELRYETFTVPSSFKVEDYLEVIVSGGDDSWVQCDGVQMVEGTRPSVYQHEDSTWLMLNSIYKPKYRMERLWSGTRYPTASQTVKPDKNLHECMNGWILQWQNYIRGSGTVNSQFQFTFIPKTFNTGHGMRIMLGHSSGQSLTKYVYVDYDKITGHDSNDSDDNHNLALTGVYEW